MKNIVRKNNIGKAVVRFLVGLVLLAVVVLLVFKLFIDPQKAENAKDVTDSTSFATPVPAADDATQAPALIVTETEEAVQYTPTPIPTPEPTPTPVPTATPAPTATPVPASEYASADSKADKYPWKVKDTTRIKNGVTSLEILASENGGSVISMTAWGYANHEGFNGKNCEIWLMIINEKEEKKCFTVKRQAGLTGITHTGLKNSKNLDQCDFTCVLDVSNFPDGEYQMGTAVRYVIDGNTRSFAYTLGDAYKFTVRSGVVTAMGGVEN